MDDIWTTFGLTHIKVKLHLTSRPQKTPKWTVNSFQAFGTSGTCHDSELFTTLSGFIMLCDHERAYK